jgi:hypothetical protein
MRRYRVAKAKKYAPLRVAKVKKDVSLRGAKAKKACVARLLGIIELVYFAIR